MFHDFDRRFSDYHERLLQGADAPWSQPDGLGYLEREAIRAEARRQQRLEISRRLAGLWRRLTGRG